MIWRWFCWIRILFGHGGIKYQNADRVVSHPSYDFFPFVSVKLLIEDSYLCSQIPEDFWRTKLSGCSPQRRLVWVWSQSDLVVVSGLQGGVCTRAAAGCLRGIERGGNLRGHRMGKALTLGTSLWDLVCIFFWPGMKKLLHGWESENPPGKMLQAFWRRFPWA